MPDSEFHCSDIEQIHQQSPPKPSRNAEAVRFSTNQRYKFKVFNASGGAPRRQLGSTSEDLNFKLAVEMGKLAV